MSTRFFKALDFYGVTYFFKYKDTLRHCTDIYSFWVESCGILVLFYLLFCSITNLPPISYTNLAIEEAVDGPGAGRIDDFFEVRQVHVAPLVQNEVDRDGQTPALTMTAGVAGEP